MDDDHSYSVLDQWFCRPTFTEEFWFSESQSIARDTDALTRALQFSLSSRTTSSSDCSAPTTTFPPGPTGKITKRKSRQSKKSTTTFINADPANFRQMVQEVTGVRLVGVDSTAVTKNPDPPRGSRSSRRVVVPSTCLPTLDTSALFLIDRDMPVQDQHRDSEIDGDKFFDLGALPTSSFFPDVKSWGVI